MNPPTKFCWEYSIENIGNTPATNLRLSGGQSWDEIKKENLTINEKTNATILFPNEKAQYNIIVDVEGQTEFKPCWTGNTLSYDILDHQSKTKRQIIKKIWKLEGVGWNEEDYWTNYNIKDNFEKNID